MIFYWWSGAVTTMEKSVYFLNIYLQSNIEHSYFSTTQPPRNSEMRIMSTLRVKLWVLSIALLTRRPHELLLETKSFQWNIDLELSCIWSLIKHTSLTYSSSSLSSASIFTPIAVSTMINWVSILLLFYYFIPIKIRFFYVIFCVIDKIYNSSIFLLAIDYSRTF